ncbi:CpaF family protein [Candidatus Omnitrophota bacterium]
MDMERIEIENEIIDKLSGKLYLLQDLPERKEVIFNVFLEVYNTPKCKKFLEENKGLDMETFFSEFLSYGAIDEFLDDPQVEDIMINSLGPIYIHRATEGLIRTDKRFTSKAELDLFVKKLVFFSGRTSVKKINNLVLSGIKGRVNVVHSPLGPQITITRAKESPLSIIDLIGNGVLSLELAGMFWLYVEGLGVKSANILISGGPGAGKTTFLNALFNFILEKERVVVIEDTFELNTGYGSNFSRLESDEDLSMEDLVKNSLRMRPDRVIVGEVRGREAKDLMTSMNIGKYCMGTLHASTARETIMRLENEPMNAPQVLINLVDVFVIMRRYNVDGYTQRVVGEVVETSGLEKKMVLLNLLCSYDPLTRKFQKSQASSVYRDRLAVISGKTPRDILDEIKVRTAVLQSLLEKNITDMQEVSRLCHRYITEPEKVLGELGLNRKKLSAR